MKKEAETMRAVVFNRHGGPEVLETVEMPRPQPQAGELLIRIVSAGISRPDHLMRTGTYPWTKDILPFFPGLYGTGIVESTGEGVEGYAPGQRVYVEHPIACGCYSEYKTAQARFVTPIPEDTDMDLAAIVNSHLIVWGMLTECFPAAEGKTLYISGAAGGIGTAVTQIAPILGMKVIASASTAEKCDYLRSLDTGAQVFCYTGLSQKEKILELTGGRGADIIMDQSVGEAFCGQLDYLAPMGTVLIYNNTRGFPSESVIKAMTDRFGACPGIRAFSFHYFDDKQELLLKKKAEVFKLLAQGAIRPHIGGMFAQSEVRAAHELLDSGAFFGSIVLHP